MTIKLGELLVTEGIIAQPDLDEALQCQIIFGGRLGTNLIEMGLIDEQNLAGFLSRKLGVPCATQERLNSVAPETLAIIPAELASKYKAIPVSLDKKRLTLAMADPTDLAAIDEISFRTGCIISPVVAPELRLILCLEHFYGIRREVRYIPLSGGEGRRRRKTDSPPSHSPSTGNSSSPVPVNPFNIDQEIIEFPPFEGFDKAPGPEPELSMYPSHPARSERHTMESLSHRLAEARDRDEIAENLIRYVGQEFERVALFLVRGKTAIGWQAVFRGKPVDDFERLEIPLDDTSLLKMVVDSKQVYRGAIPLTPSNKRMIDALGGGSPAIAHLMPLLILGRVVTILYVDGRHDDLEARLFDLQKLIGKVAMAFEILILKNKILMG